MDPSNHRSKSEENVVNLSDNESNSSGKSEKQIRCIFIALMEKDSQKSSVSNKNMGGDDTLGLDNEALPSHISLKGSYKSTSSTNISNAELVKNTDVSVKNTDVSLNPRLSKSETDCLNHFNDMIETASKSQFKMSSNDLENIVETPGEECIVPYTTERARSASSKEDLAQADIVFARLQSGSTQPPENMAIETSETSLECSNIDKISTSSEPVENSKFSNKKDVEIKTSTERDDDVCSSSNDFNMSVENDRIKSTFEDFLHEVNDACGIKICSEHEIDAIINLNSNESETAATCKVDTVTVSQDQIQNTNVVQHNSANDMKAVFLQVLRTWADRQREISKNRDPHDNVSHAKADTRNIPNVREYVQQLERCLAQNGIKETPKIKKEFYGNMLHKVLEEDKNEQVLEVPEETRQLLDEACSNEQLKQKFYKILHMFQEMTKENKISNKKIPKHGKCFNYMKRSDEDKNMSFQDQNKQSLSFNDATTTKSVGTNKVCATRNVAEQTEVISQYSFCCQVSLFACKLENEVQTDEIYSTTIDKDDIKYACDTLLHEQQTIRDNTSPIRDLNTEESGMSLTKVSDSQMDLLPSSHKNAPCESNFHTIRIEATSTPPLSAMQRPPLCTRFWKVVKQFCMATCFCIQVNKDCVFFMAFFVMLLMCTSLLTAFFYRNLQVDSRMLHPPMMIRRPIMQASAMAT